MTTPSKALQQYDLFGTNIALVRAIQNNEKSVNLPLDLVAMITSDVKLTIFWQ